MPEATSNSTVTIPGGISTNDILDSLSASELLSALTGGTVTAGDGSAINNNTYYQPVDISQNFGGRSVTSLSGGADRLQAPDLMPLQPMAAMPQMPALQRANTVGIQDVGRYIAGMSGGISGGRDADAGLVAIPASAAQHDYTIAAKPQRFVDKMMGVKPQTPQEMQADIEAFYRKEGLPVPPAPVLDAQPQPLQSYADPVKLQQQAPVNARRVPVQPQASPVQLQGQAQPPGRNPLANYMDPGIRQHFNPTNAPLTPMEEAVLNSIQKSNNLKPGSRFLRNLATGLNSNVAAREAARTKAQAGLLKEVMNNQAERFVTMYKQYGDLQGKAMDNDTKIALKKMELEHAGDLTKKQALDALQAAQVMPSSPAKQAIMNQVANTLNEPAIALEGSKSSQEALIKLAGDKADLNLKIADLDKKLAYLANMPDRIKTEDMKAVADAQVAQDKAANVNADRAIRAMNPIGNLAMNARMMGVKADDPMMGQLRDATKQLVPQIAKAFPQDQQAAPGEQPKQGQVQQTAQGMPQQEDNPFVEQKARPIGERNPLLGWMQDVAFQNRGNPVADAVGQQLLKIPDGLNMPVPDDKIYMESAVRLVGLEPRPKNSKPVVIKDLNTLRELKQMAKGNNDLLRATLKDFGYIVPSASPKVLEQIAKANPPAVNGMVPPPPPVMGPPPSPGQPTGYRPAGAPPPPPGMAAYPATIDRGGMSGNGKQKMVKPPQVTERPVKNNRIKA